MTSLKNKQQAGRFALVGAANTLLDFGLLFLLRSIGIPTIVANFVSTTIAFLSSFVANKKYTFKTKNANLRREVVLFVLVTLFGLWVLQSFVLWLTIPWLETTLTSHQYALLMAKLLATIVSMTWNYVLYTKLVFKKPMNSFEQ